jgi:hypothetical protein
MSEQTQEAGAVTSEAGGTQNEDAGQKPAGEGQVDASKPPEGDKPAESQKTEEVVYDFKAPEGVELDAASTDEFKAIAKELNLSKDAAQKVVDLAVKREQARAEAFAKQVEDWANQVQRDPELGKPETLAAARKVVETFGDDETKSLLNSTGMGNHPALVRFMVKVSKAISEDKFVAGRDSSEPTKKDPASVLYGNNP